MINTEQYKKILNDFSEIDLTSSEVYFSHAKINVNDTTFDVTLPQIKNKPCALFRLIRKIYYFIFQNYPYLSIAHQIEVSITNAIQVLPAGLSESVLLDKISNVAYGILGNLKNPKLNKSEIDEIAEIDQTIKDNCADAILSNYLRQNVDDIQSSNLSQNVDDIQSNYLRQIKYACLQKKIRHPDSLEVAYSINWDSCEQDNPILFSYDYVNELISTIIQYNESFRIIEYLHSDLRNSRISNNDIKVFTRFLYDLMNKLRIRDHYGNFIGVENTDRLRKMILGIMNILNERRDESDFQESYAAVICDICRALDNCSNGINTNIEHLFMKLSFPKDGAIGERVKLVLQSMREDIFRKAIFHCINESDRPRYYLEHEASSVNYYFREMAEEFGLPASVSSLDDRFEGYALKGVEDEIRDYFIKQYTPQSILHTIWKIINDPYDASIPKNLFLEWVKSKYSLDEMYNLLDYSGKYRVELVLQYLLNLKIIQSIV